MSQKIYGLFYFFIVLLSGCKSIKDNHQEFLGNANEHVYVIDIRCFNTTSAVDAVYSLTRGRVSIVCINVMELGESLLPERRVRIECTGAPMDLQCLLTAIYQCSGLIDVSYHKMN